FTSSSVYVFLSAIARPPQKAPKGRPEIVIPGAEAPGMTRRTDRETASGGAGLLDVPLAPPLRQQLFALPPRLRPVPRRLPRRGARCADLAPLGNHVRAGRPDLPELARRAVHELEVPLRVADRCRRWRRRWRRSGDRVCYRRDRLAGRRGGVRVPVGSQA